MNQLRTFSCGGQVYPPCEFVIASEAASARLALEFPILTKNSDFNEDKAVLKDTKIKFKTILCRQAIALTEKENVFLQRNRPVATTKNDL
jgi:hypothetical protein